MYDHRFPTSLENDFIQMKEFSKIGTAEGKDRKLCPIEVTSNQTDPIFLAKKNKHKICCNNKHKIVHD